jgi:hypothetical protein
MIEKINVRVDLSKYPVMQHEMGEEEQDGELDPIAKHDKKQEEKLDAYILKFINLNCDNREIL